MTTNNNPTQHANNSGGWVTPAPVQIRNAKVAEFYAVEKMDYDHGYGLQVQTYDSRYPNQNIKPWNIEAPEGSPWVENQNKDDYSKPIGGWTCYIKGELAQELNWFAESCYQKSFYLCVDENDRLVAATARQSQIAELAGQQKKTSGMSM